ncbi:MAG: hypothetical protein O2955_01280 [Planctomycetota bacterium]|nr:hypothetical protein [Planctomycetota bacterium]MDA1211115.1 hypothetical protein [Planctomycetota bacterium]
MVVSTGLAMFSFIFLDSLQQSNQSSPVIIGILFGGFGMWILGLIRGKWLEYALIGVVGGGVAGFMLTFASQPAPRVTTSVGDFSDEDLNELIVQRRIANQFLEMAFYESRKADELNTSQMPRGALFAYGRPLEEDVVLGYILTQEAKQMGLTISDEAIERFINQVTTNQLSKVKFDKVVRQEMRLSSIDLFNILREQLLARQALEMTAPQALQTPEQYWEYYQRFKVTQELELTAVPVSAFIDSVAEPKDQELIAFFEANKSVFPNQTSNGAPGFRQPRKISLAYVEARPQPLEAEVDEVTDKEVEEYYNTNKELYRELSTNLLEESASDDDPFETGSPAEEDKNEINDDTAEETPEGETTTEESNDEESENDESSDSGAEPVQSAGEFAATVLSAGANFSVADTDDEITLAQNEEDNDETENSSGDETATEDAPPSDSTAPDESSVEFPPTTGKTKSSLSEPTYRPLDDDLKSEIRNEIHRRRLRELVNSRMDAARAFMSDLAEKYKFAEDETQKLSKNDMAARLKEFAEKNGLTYGEVPQASFAELSDPDKYPVGSAEEPNDNPLSFEETMNVRVQFFQAGPDELYSVFLANDPLTDVAYAVWKTGELASHVPTLDDPGIREEVLSAWKTEKARPLAEKRAQELMELLKASPQPWSEALSETTVTGEKEGLQLTVQSTEKFSWMRTTTAPSSNMFSLPEPVLSTISTVDKAGDDFMRVVFKDLKAREIGAVPNADRSIYYVVKVRNRFPSTAEETVTLRESFLRDGQDFLAFAPCYRLASADEQQGLAKWSQLLEEKYNVLWRQPETDETMNK